MVERNGHNLMCLIVASLAETPSPGHVADAYNRETFPIGYLCVFAECRLTASQPRALLMP